MASLITITPEALTDALQGEAYCRCGVLADIIEGLIKAATDPCFDRHNGPGEQNLLDTAQHASQLLKVYGPTSPDETAEQIVLAHARSAAKTAKNWIDLENMLFSPVAGIVSRAFPDRQDREVFVKTAEYREIRQLIAAQWERDRSS